MRLKAVETNDRECGVFIGFSSFFVSLLEFLKGRRAKNEKKHEIVALDPQLLGRSI